MAGMANKIPAAELKRQTRILIVEDNLSNQRVICTMLELAGYVADVVSDGNAAIKALESTAYDLVLMDCYMPVMDGFSACRLIRAPDSRVLDPNVPIIAVTALAMEADVDKCLNAGMNEHMSKPIRYDTLINTIEKYLTTAFRREAEVEKVEVIESSSKLAQFDPPANDSQVPHNFELDTGLLESIIKLFMEDAPNQIAKLESAIQKRDCNKLVAISHKIRGSSCVLGTHEITKRALAVETMGQNGDFEKVADLGLILVAELKMFLASLAGTDGQKNFQGVQI